MRPGPGESRRPPVWVSACLFLIAAPLHRRLAYKALLGNCQGLLEHCCPSCRFATPNAPGQHGHDGSIFHGLAGPDYSLIILPFSLGPPMLNRGLEPCSTKVPGRYCQNYKMGLRSGAQL